MLKPVYAALLLAGTGLGLAACSDSAETPSEIGPEGIAGLEITNPRMMLPPVAGNPAAVYFDIAYDGERNLALRSADVAGAERAVMHDMMEYDFEMTMGEMPPLMLTLVPATPTDKLRDPDLPPPHRTRSSCCDDVPLGHLFQAFIVNEQLTRTWDIAWRYGAPIHL